MIKLEFNKGRVPLKVWTTDIEPEAIEQLINVSKLPIVHGHVAEMPDVHQPYRRLITDLLHRSIVMRRVQGV